jgi:hypothetical protein
MKVSLFVTAIIWIVSLGGTIQMAEATGDMLEFTTGKILDEKTEQKVFPSLKTSAPTITPAPSPSPTPVPCKFIFRNLSSILVQCH